MKEISYELSEEQRKFLEEVLELNITRWPIRIERILKYGKYNELDRIKMNEVRYEYIKHKRSV